MSEESRQPDRVWSSRKYTAAWLLTWLATGLLMGKYLDANAWSSTVSLTWLGYFTSNVGEKFVDRKSK